MKIRMRVDVSEVNDHTAEALRALDAHPGQMKRAIDRAAAKERQSHDYQNRTGELERNTVGTELLESDNQFACALIADTEYASYVNMRGLMTIDDSANEVSAELEYNFDAGAAAKIVGT